MAVSVAKLGEMSFQYSIEHAEPAQVHNDLLRLWWDNLPVARESADAKYQWTYLDPPDRPDGVFVLKAQRDGEGTHIVGTAGLGCRRFFAAGRALRAGLLGDLAVDRDHRTALPALRLVREARRAALEHFDFAYGYPNHSAEGVFLRCGYHKLGIMSRYAAVLRYAPYVRRVLDVPVLPRIAGAGLDALRMGARMPRMLQALRHFRLEWLDDVDDRFDALWPRARDEYPIIGQRDARFLRWRFLRHPTERFEIAALAENRPGKELHAYAVVQRQGRAAYLRDLFGKFESLGPLLDLLLPALRVKRCTSVSFDYLGARRMVDLLLSRSFEYRHSDRTIIVEAGNSLAREASGVAALLDDVERWYLTDADEDT
jgi:hypothetical protein